MSDMRCYAAYIRLEKKSISITRLKLQFRERIGRQNLYLEKKSISITRLKHFLSAYRG